VEKARMEVWAYGLMPNHVHLVAVPREEAGLARAIGEAHRRCTNFIDAPGALDRPPLSEPLRVRADGRRALRHGRAHCIAQPRAGAPGCARRGPAMVERPSPGRDDGLVTVKPVRERVGDFAKPLAPDAADEDRFAAVRRSETTGRPLATPEFVAGLERLPGRPIARRAPGRKPNSRP
jgi:putative transposase